VTGRKDDTSKPQLHLLLDFSQALTAVGEVATFGAHKYAPGNWLHVSHGKDRYTSALLRHLLESANSDIDSETGLNHLAHVAWNALAILEFQIREQQNKLKQNNADL